MHLLWAFICRVECLPISGRVRSLLHSFAPGPSLQASVSQWLQNALDGEVAEWGREQGPNTDPSGSYYSPMPAIVLQVGGKWPDRQAPSMGQWGGEKGGRLC